MALVAGAGRHSIDASRGRCASCWNSLPASEGRMPKAESVMVYRQEVPSNVLVCFLTL